MKTTPWLVGGLLLPLALTGCTPPVPPPAPEPPGGEVHLGPLEGSETLPVAPTQVPASRAGARARIEAAVQNVRSRDLLTSNGFWTVFHGILGLGPGVPLRDEATGKRVNAVDYVFGGGQLRGLDFRPTRHGVDVISADDRTRFVGQGHQDQFVAEMAQWGMPANRQVKVGDETFSFLDFARHSLMRASLKEKQELSWAVIVIGQYYSTDLKWKNGRGEQLKYQDLIRYELDADIDTSACGGTHRLFGLSWAYHLHRQRGGDRTGVWADVARKTARYRDLARKYQNPDGLLSTSYFRGPGHAADPNARISTTGHMLEWLALALPNADLKQPWLEDAANALALTILDQQGAPIEGGALYHAVHGLLLYYARVYDRHTLGPTQLFYPPVPDERLDP